MGDNSLPFFGTGSGGYQWPLFENLPTSNDIENARNWFQSGEWVNDMASWTGVNPNCPIHGNRGRNPANNGRSSSLGSTPPNSSPYYSGVSAAAAAAAAAIQRSLAAAAMGGGEDGATGSGGVGQHGSAATSGRQNPSTTAAGRPGAARRTTGSNPSGSTRPSGPTTGRPSAAAERPSNPYADYIASANAARSGQGAGSSIGSGSNSNWANDQFNHYFGNGSRDGYSGSVGARPRVGSAPRPDASSGSGSSRIRVIRACPPRG